MKTMKTVSVLYPDPRDLLIGGTRYTHAGEVPFRIWFDVLRAMVRDRLMLRRTRRQLLDLDDALLRDIGLTREEVLREAVKSHPLRVAGLR